ncbi:hypothetical protein GVO57_07445 [Sphingomonas changnyeongensis]|uniref:Uncharacterized protein n=1 Tax=Sphingomonas changnyeongensis TaxID=2698679 RepID=A0A7Z2NWM7_9SPHN|nr:phage tail tube protein [Sphingomonas changnyeongensis]QHL90700.1 hypothetical protein GVO57_07445 [Sphingomonas changnyeongensis]
MVDVVKTILFKKEAVYGTDAVPTAAANAALTRNFQRTPVQTDTLERNLDVPSRGRSPTGSTNARSAFSYELELAGSGAAGTAPAWMEHLEACGMAAPTLVAGQSASLRFAAAGAALSSATAYHWRGNQQAISLGARGTYGFNFTAGAYPFLSLSFVGMLPTGQPVVEAAPAAPDFSRWRAPLEVNTANTDFTLDGYAAKLQSLTGEIGAQPAIRNLVGENYVQRGNHALTGQMVIKAPSVAERNYFATLRAGAEISCELIHGTAAGNIIELVMGFLQILAIEEQEDGDDLMYTISYGANVRAGQDDIIWRAK